jgi:hypothetical protein
MFFLFLIEEKKYVFFDAPMQLNFKKQSLKFERTGKCIQKTR